MLCIYSNRLYFSCRTAAQNEVALSYHRVRGLYFLAVVFVATMVKCEFFVVVSWFIIY